MRDYFRPIPMVDPARPDTALRLACGWCWFDRVERLRRGHAPEILPAADLPDDLRARLTTPRDGICGLTLDAPRIMAILNVTPDSFSDGGRFDGAGAAIAEAEALIAAGADILDIGGESTRPGADTVPVVEEIARTRPVIEALAHRAEVPISIDTRKADVARAALTAGAHMVNDVSALTHDPRLAEVTAQAGVPICLMHAQGDPKTMQHGPEYADVLLDVYDALEARVAAAEAAGIPRARIVVDPGIGFGKTLEHNLTLLARLSLFHGLGCPVLLGASRKRFIGTVGDEQDAAKRAPGSIAVALSAIRQGIQIVRVHDMPETRQAMQLDAAIRNVGTGTV